MDQHPVPQNIASYEFRLVGDMTLKQFLELAAGLVIALMFYASGLPGYIKWPLVFISALLGVGLAFFPIEERPLEIWLMSFIKTIYSPTQYLWKKAPKKPEFLEERPARPPEAQIEKVTPADRLKMTEYLSTLPENRNFLDQKEEDFVNRVQNLFAISSFPPKLDKIVAQHPTPAPAVLPPSPTASAPSNVRKLSGPFVLEVDGDEGSIYVQPNKPEAEKIDLEEIKINYVPKNEPVETQTTAVEYTPRSQDLGPSGPPPLPYIPPPILFRERKPSLPAKFATEVPPPSIPTLPNIIAGTIVDPSGRLMENVILEIKDQYGNSARALRTNKIGQFRIATQLPNGSFDIVCEKEGYAFDNVRVELKGEIVQPIEIKAK